MTESPVNEILKYLLPFLIAGFLGSGVYTGGILTDPIWWAAFGTSLGILNYKLRERRPLIRNLTKAGYLIYYLFLFYVIYYVRGDLSIGVFPHHILEFSALVFLLILPALAVLILVR